MKLSLFDHDELASFRDIAKENDMPLPITSKALGCGNYGCVFETEDPKRVMKWTSQYDEAVFMALQCVDRAPGFVGVDQVFEIGRNEYLIWRDMLHLCCSDAIEYVGKLLGGDAATEISSGIGMIGMGGYDEDEIESLSSIKGMQDFANGLDQYWERGYIISDFHVDNFGAYKDLPEVVCYDCEIQSRDGSDVEDNIIIL